MIHRLDSTKADSDARDDGREDWRLDFEGGFWSNMKTVGGSKDCYSIFHVFVSLSALLIERNYYAFFANNNAMKKTKFDNIMILDWVLRNVRLVFGRIQRF